MARTLLLLSGAVALSILARSASSRAADCFVDSVAGSDANDGMSELTALASPGKIPAGCSAVKFKRGSEFKLDLGEQNLGLPSQMLFSSIKLLTNYGDSNRPLPKFVKDHVDGSGGIIQVFAPITIDGLFLSGSKSENAMTHLADGVCVMLGAGSKLLNSEITLCDIGIMTAGDDVQVMHNYVHDLSISVDAPHGVDPNLVGGAEGIFVNSSHVEVAYNRFVNCTSRAEWVTITPDKPRCDGGATEVTVPLDGAGAGGEVTDVRIHHNFSYNSCGFFEVSTMPQAGSAYVKGKFSNSIFHDNVMVDSGWISLLQLNNTRLSNVTWANNTIVHHYLPSVKDAGGKTVDLNDFGSSYIQAIPFNDTSSGVTGGGVLEQGDVFWTNNLWYFEQAIIDQFHISAVDATRLSTDSFLANVVVRGDKFVTLDPGFVDVSGTSDPSAFDLLGSASGAIDRGVDLAGVGSDFLDRPRPYGAAPDLGAFEFHGGSAAGGGVTAQAGGSDPGNPHIGESGRPASGGAGPGPLDAGESSGGAKAIGAGPSNVAGYDAPTLGAERSGCSCQSAGNQTPATATLLFGLAIGSLSLRRRSRKG